MMKLEGRQIPYTVAVNVFFEKNTNQGYGALIVGEAPIFIAFPLPDPGQKLPAGEVEVRINGCSFGDPVPVNMLHLIRTPYIGVDVAKIIELTYITNKKVRAERNIFFRFVGYRDLDPDVQALIHWPNKLRRRQTWPVSL